MKTKIEEYKDRMTSPIGIKNVKKPKQKKTTKAAKKGK